MSRISVEATEESHIAKLFGSFGEIRALGVANDIKPVRLIRGQPPFTDEFYRLFPYGMENWEVGFNPEKYREATEILNGSFADYIGDPDKSYRGMVRLSIKDYRGKTSRKAAHYLIK